MSGPSGMGKPAFMPASVRSQQAQQAPAAIPVSPAAVISKPATWQDDEDVFSTLLKYEKEVRAEKKEKKHFEKQKKAMGLGGGTSMMKPKELPKPQMPLDVPRDISQLSAGARELAEKYKVEHKELLPEPDLEDRKKAKPAKPATEVTPAQISAKAQQMVEMVKASQVLSVEKRLAGNPLASGGLQNNVVSDKEDAKRKGKKTKKMIRMAGGQTWEDQSLLNWDSNDYRLFAGDLGNDVTDEVLSRTFGRYPSFQMAKVVRDKRSNKTKGYGFVSFKSPDDFTKAIKEMNGRYVGSRPIKLSKSNWKDRNVEVVKEKQHLKKKMGYKY